MSWFSQIVDLTCEEQKVEPRKNKQIVSMSPDELIHLLSEVEKKQNTDAKAALNLLKLIGGGAQSIEVLD